MRIVCDTNVLVSGLLFGGNCRTILRLVSEGRFEGFTSVMLLAELEGVLLRPKFGLTAPHVAAIIDLVRQTFTTVSSVATVCAIAEDPDDDAVLGTAVAAAADMIVSGDDHLLRLGEFRGIRIVSPGPFLAGMGSQPAAAG
jgi:putative PIN family toxin of toxin-antitoxin system